MKIHASVLSIILCFVVVQLNSITANQTIGLHNIQVPPLKHIVLVETIANIFSTVVPFAKIIHIRLATIPMNEADLLDLDNMVKVLYQRNNYQFLEMDPQNIYREPLQLQRHVMIVVDTQIGFL